jgi:hypothetical protein
MHMGHAHFPMIKQEQAVKGGSCHQCKNVKPLIQLRCCSNLKPTRDSGASRTCRKKFCTGCLGRFYSPGIQWLVANEGQCVSCLGLCACASCLRKRVSDTKANATMKHYLPHRNGLNAAIAVTSKKAVTELYDWSNPDSDTDLGKLVGPMGKADSRIAMCINGQKAGFLFTEFDVGMNLDMTKHARSDLNCGNDIQNPSMAVTSQHLVPQLPTAATLSYPSSSFPSSSMHMAQIPQQLLSGSGHQVSDLKQQMQLHTHMRMLYAQHTRTLQDLGGMMQRQLQQFPHLVPMLQQQQRAEQQQMQLEMHQQQNMLLQSLQQQGSFPQQGVSPAASFNTLSSVHSPLSNSISLPSQLMPQANAGLKRKHSEISTAPTEEGVTVSK